MYTVMFLYAQRCPLESIVLKAKKLNLGEPKKILSYALQPPNLGDIERAILNLKEVNKFTSKFEICVDKVKVHVVPTQKAS